MQLMCDILVHDSKSNACLNDEQRSLLANFNHRGANVTQHKSKRYRTYSHYFLNCFIFPFFTCFFSFVLFCFLIRLSVIDESSFLSHSDISYDRTDDDMVGVFCWYLWLNIHIESKIIKCQSWMWLVHVSLFCREHFVSIWTGPGCDSRETT